jgi:elongation factor 1-beta
MKPIATGPPGKPAGAPAAPAKKEENDDDLDLFGDDDEADAEAAKKAAAAAKEGAQKKKKEVKAMSLVMLDVKPMDDTINLDDLAQKIYSEVT